MENVILTMLLMYSAPNAIPADVLAVEIERVSTRYSVDPILVTQIVLQESRGYSHAYNASSHDHGLMQINQKTALNRNISAHCLYDWRCNLERGVELLASYKKHADFQACHYNTGRVGSKRDGGKKCLAYQTSLSKYAIN